MKPVAVKNLAPVVKKQDPVVTQTAPNRKLLWEWRGSLQIAPVIRKFDPPIIKKMNPPVKKVAVVLKQTPEVMEKAAPLVNGLAPVPERVAPVS